MGERLGRRHDHPGAAVSPSAPLAAASPTGPDPGGSGGSSGGSGGSPSSPATPTGRVGLEVTTDSRGALVVSRLESAGVLAMRLTRWGAWLVGDSARVLWVDDVVLGRHGEPPGSWAFATRIESNDRVLVTSRLGLGPAEPGWASPAGLGGALAAVGILVVERPGHAIDAVSTWTRQAKVMGTLLWDATNRVAQITVWGDRLAPCREIAQELLAGPPAPEWVPKLWEEPGLSGAASAEGGAGRAPGAGAGDRAGRRSGDGLPRAPNVAPALTGSS